MAVQHVVDISLSSCSVAIAHEGRLCRPDYLNLPSGRVRRGPGGGPAPLPLIPCPDCGHDVSASAAACPSCGRPMHHPKRIERWNHPISLPQLLIVIGAAEIIVQLFLKWVDIHVSVGDLFQADWDRDIRSGPVPVRQTCVGQRPNHPRRSDSSSRLGCPRGSDPPEDPHVRRWRCRSLRPRHVRIPS